MPRYRWWLVVAFGLFAAGLVVGLLLPAGSDGGLLSSLEGMAGGVTPFAVSTVVFIYFKNALAVLASFFFAPFLLLMPLVTLTLNGVILGLVGAMTVRNHSVGYLLAGVLPHGIIELSAVFIAEAAAFSFGLAVMTSLFKKERRAELPGVFRQNLRWLWLSLVLLVPAAFIETYVTPLLIR